MDQKHILDTQAGRPITWGIGEIVGTLIGYLRYNYQNEDGTPGQVVYEALIQTDSPHVLLPFNLIECETCTKALDGELVVYTLECTKYLSKITRNLLLIKLDRCNFPKDLAKYPHICLNCNEPAYMGIMSIDCSHPLCRHHKG